MSGFADVAVPASFLKPPKTPEKPTPGFLPVDIINSVGELVSPTFWLTKALEVTIQVNPVDEVVQWFAGDWESFAKASEAWENLGKAFEAVAENLRAGNADLDASWDGNAADAAYVYFDEFAKKIADCREGFDELKAIYDELTLGAYHNANALKTVLTGIADAAILLGISLAAGVLTTAAGVGLVFYGLAIAQGARVLALWGEATQILVNAQNIANSGSGTILQLGAQIRALLASFPSVGTAYDNPAVPSETATAGN